MVQEPVHCAEEQEVLSAERVLVLAWRHDAAHVQFRQGSVVPRRHYLYEEEFSAHDQTSSVEVEVVYQQVEVHHPAWVVYAADLVLDYHRHDCLHRPFE